MEDLVDSLNLVYMEASEWGHFPECTIQWNQAAGGCCVFALDVAQRYGERFFYAL